MSDLLKGSFGLMKQLNISMILEVIRREGAISRAEIAEVTGLTPASVSKITKDLISRGFIKEGALGESSGGRPPVLLKLNPKAGYIIGVNLGPERLEVVLTDLEAKVINKFDEKIDNIEKKYVLDRLFNLIKEIIIESNIVEDEIIGIGMAVHGLVNSETGISIFAPHYHWRDVEIKKLVEEKFKIPTFIDNDVRAMALAEHWFGVAKGIDNFVTINVSNGIGSGIMIDGSLYYGVDYGAGEIGHTIVDNNGPQCSCGNYGCLEALAANPYIVQRVIKVIKQGVKSRIVELVNKDLERITVKIICQAAREGDEVAIQILKEVGRYLGIGIAQLLNILNPCMVVIVGDIIKSGSYLFDSIKETVEIRALDGVVDNVKIFPTDLDENAPVIGGVTLVLKELFKGAELL